MKTSARHRLAALQIGQRGRENIRYASLFRHLRSVRVFGLLLPRGSVIGKLYRTVNNYLLYPHLYHRLLRCISRRYPYFLATDLGQIPYLQCPVIVDDDDPEFSPSHLALLNQDHVRVVVTPSEQLRQTLFASGLRKECVVIPSGVHLEALDPASVAAVRRRMGKQRDDIVVGFAVPALYLEEHKPSNGAPDGLRHITFLTEVMELVWREQPRIQVWLMGDPSPSVIAYAKQRPQVRLLGYVPHRQILSYYACLDIALYPRLCDVGGRHSIKLLEYMACGCPVVSTAVSESYLVSQSEAGVIATSAEEFAQHVLDLARDGRRRAELGQRGREFAAGYDWRALAERYEREVFDTYAPE